MYIPVPLLSLFQLHAQRNRYIQLIVGCWAKSLIWLAGGTIEISGAKNLPRSRQICYIANHQGNFDIPIMPGFLPGPIGFMAKKELGTPTKRLSPRGSETCQDLNSAELTTRLHDTITSALPYGTSRVE